jgi:hypothetical protein
MPEFDADDKLGSPVAAQTGTVMDATLAATVAAAAPFSVATPVAVAAEVTVKVSAKMTTAAEETEEDELNEDMSLSPSDGKHDTLDEALTETALTEDWEPEAEDTSTPVVPISSPDTQPRKNKKQQQHRPVPQPGGAAQEARRSCTTDAVSFIGRLRGSLGGGSLFGRARASSEDDEFVAEPTAKQKPAKQKPQKIVKQKAQKSLPQQRRAQWLDFLVPWKARLEKNAPFVFACACMLAIVLLGKTSGGNLKQRSSDEKDPCWSGTGMPSYINATLGSNDLPDVTYILPTITLYAPCLLDNYVRIARRYRRSASDWHYVKITDRIPSKIELRNRNEEPVVMHRGLESNDTILDWLSNNCLPKVGRLTDFSAQFYLGREQGLIVGLFEPDLDMEEVEKVFRPMLAEVGDAFKQTYFVNYMDTKENVEWIQSEFGVTRFPAVVVVRSYPGPAFVYEGPFAAKPIIAYVQDVDKGCFDYQPWDMRRAFAAQQDPPDPTCDATSILSEVPPEMVVSLGERSDDRNDTGTHITEDSQEELEKAVEQPQAFDDLSDTCSNCSPGEVASMK